MNLKAQNALLIVVDVINGFLYEGPLADHSIEHIVIPIIQLIQQFDKYHQSIIAFIDCHELDAKEFDSYPAHCIRDTSEAELVPVLKQYEHKMTIIEKNSTNGFQTDYFLNYINQNHFDSIVITGCCTDICVLQFALSLKGFLNEHNLNTNVIIPVDTIDTFHSESHDREYFNRISLELMRNAGIQIIDTLEIEG